MLSVPTVSVIVTVLNGETFLPLALESIFRQTLAEFELIIVDDGSTDITPAQLRSISDPRLRVICNHRTLGPAAARNVGIEAARGLYCAFLDHDDIALPSRLERQVGFLDSDPAAGLVGSAFEVIDVAGKNLARIRMPEAPLAIRWMGLFDCPMRQSSVMGRSELVKRHRYDARFPNYSDWDFIMRVSREAEVRNLSDVLVQYRRHETNLTKLNSNRLDKIGIDLALREIRSELPDFAIDRDEIADIRAVLFGTSQGAEQKSLAMARRAVERYLDLEQAFRQRYPEHAPGRIPAGTIGSAI
jgi:glycosyltransferase involved in cell wall biosynthesis